MDKFPDQTLMLAAIVSVLFFMSLLNAPLKRRQLHNNSAKSASYIDQYPHQFAGMNDTEKQEKAVRALTWSSFMVFAVSAVCWLVWYSCYVTHQDFFTTYGAAGVAALSLVVCAATIVYRVLDLIVFYFDHTRPARTTSVILFKAKG